MFSLFPEVVNEKSARIVAAGVILLCVGTVFYPPLAALVALGFLLRVFAGDRFSPLARIANRVIAPKLGNPIYVPGPPKRFAQSMGFIFSLATFLLFLFQGPYLVPLLFLVFAAFFEAALGICLGCRIFALLMKTGIVPDHICEACANWSPR